jgi:hypothetical protein
MLNQIKTLLNDTQLRQQLKAVNSLADEIALIKSAGAQKGYQFSHDGLAQLLQRQRETIDEKALLDIAGSGLAKITGNQSGCSIEVC